MLWFLWPTRYKQLCGLCE